MSYFKRERRRLHVSAAISALLHLGVAAAFAYSVAFSACEAEREPLGSIELDLEEVAPRLAPPKSHHENALGTRGGAEAIAPSPAVAAVRARRSVQARPDRPEARPAVPRPRGQQADPLARARALPASTAPSGDVPAAAGLTAHQRELPAEIDPTALLAAVESEHAQRERRRAELAHEQQRRQQRVERLWSQIVSDDEGQLKVNAAGGQALGQGGRDQAGRRGGLRYGLKFYLSGRQRLTSKVVVPPQLIEFPKDSCKLVDPRITPATVRMLVTLDGDVHVAYLKHRSGNARFDRCALKQVKGMRFKPGTDINGAPLDVWIHVRVEPTNSLTVAAR